MTLLSMRFKKGIVIVYDNDTAMSAIDKVTKLLHIPKRHVYVIHSQMLNINN